jgi:hypothetical protein
VRGRLLRKREYDLAVTQWRHCERSEAVSFSQGRRDCFTRRKDEVRNDTFCGSLRAKRSNPAPGQEFLRLLRKRHDDLAVTLLTGHSEPRSGEESLRLLRRRYYDLAVTTQKAKNEIVSEAKRRPRSDAAGGRCGGFFFATTRGLLSLSP